MILAAPLVIPFAEAVGISIATLGMAKAADMVNDYIQENPEQSAMILKTLVPNLGIGEIFMNKEDSGDDEEVEVEEDTRSKKEIVLGELGKDKGNYSDEDAEGKYSSKRGRIIRALEDAGKVNPDREYNPEKKYQGYKRFIRPKKADGGAIGIEVLFEPKVPAAPSQLVEESEIVLGYRGPGGYQGGSSSRSSSSSSSTNQGPAGGASAGGNYGGNRNPSQTYGGSIFSGGGGNQNTNKILNKIKKANPPGKSPFQKFLAHDRFTDMMKVSRTPNYHQMGGLDFMARFPDINPNVAKGLATAYQNIFEYGRAIADGPGGITFEDAGKKADEESRLNKIGIDDFYDPNSETYKQYTSDTFGLKPAAVQMADGGRVGLFMGGSPLDGQALAIYNSMNAYGFDDQAIADALQEQGLYTPGGSTPDPTPDTGQTIGYQGGNDSPYAGQVVDQTDYGFNKKNYAPGEKLEINPAAFGVSFPDQPSGPKKEGIINQAIDSFTSLPTRSLSSFASPTTGGNIVGPAEQGFMGQTLDIDPAGRTREEIRSLYDNYNRFLGRTSNFADARQKGKAGEVLGNIVGFASGIPFLGKGIDKLTDVFGPQGDKSLQSKYTVDGAGFGNTGARDEFGLATFDRKDGFLGLTGDTTRDYTDRMNERLGKLTDFFGSRIEGFDINNLDDATLDKMSKINGFYTKQIQAYKQRLATENINRNTQDAIKAQAEAKKKEEAAFQAQLNETQRQQRMSDLQRIERAYRQDTGGRGGSYATGESGVQSDGSYNDPFDPGGGEKDGGFIDGYNRRKYSQGGLATMFTRKR